MDSDNMVITKGKEGEERKKRVMRGINDDERKLDLGW